MDSLERHRVITGLIGFIFVFIASFFLDIYMIVLAATADSAALIVLYIFFTLIFAFLVFASAFFSYMFLKLLRQSSYGSSYTISV